MFSGGVTLRRWMHLMMRMWRSTVMSRKRAKRYIQKHANNMYSEKEGSFLGGFTFKIIS